MRGDAITVDELYHSVFVDPPVGYDADYWYTVENPCQRTLSAQVGGSTSSSTLDFAWAGQFGHFLIESQQVAVGAAGGSTISSSGGSITITPSEDLSLWLHSSFAYDLHGQMQARLSTWVSGGDQPGLFSQTEIYDTIDGPPYSGTLQIGAEVNLPAGHTWVLGYSMMIYAFQGSTGLTGTGAGSVSFEIFPEPASLALLAPLLLAVRRRETRHRRC